MPVSFAVLHVEVSDRVAARDLYRFVALFENLYSWHVLLDHMDVRHVEAPTQFLPPPEEELLVNRLEIGTPNFIELLGLVQPLLDSTAWIATVAGAALTGIRVVKGSYEIRKTRAEALKLEHELRLAKEQNRVMSESAANRVREPDLLKRTRMHAPSFTEDEMHNKEDFIQYAEVTARELLPSFAKQPTIVIFEHEGA